jgi:hypothetical protein
MPRLPRVSGAETICALEQLGFSQIRQRGSHVVLKRIGPRRRLPADWYNFNLPETVEALQIMANFFDQKVGR